MYRELTQGIEIEVKPEYMVKESAPEQGQYIFSYHITIVNRGETEVQLLSRHWFITDGLRKTREVKGPGVVGETPTLKPGEKHEYSSFCQLPTPSGNMRGTFQMVNNLGAHFNVKIPLFFLRDLRNMH